MQVDIEAGRSQAKPAEAFGQHFERLRWLADMYEQAQKLRIGVNNRVDAVTRGVDEEAPDAFVGALGSGLEGIENKLRREMGRVLKTHPAWPWLGRWNRP